MYFVKGCNTGRVKKEIQQLKEEFENPPARIARFVQMPFFFSPPFYLDAAHSGNQRTLRADRFASAVAC